MTIKKGDQFRTTYSNLIYEVAGRWGREIVLWPVRADNEECLIYTAGEIEELLEEGRLIRIERSEMKALFGRKMADIEELRRATRIARKEGFTGLAYEVIKEVALSDFDFKEFTKDLLEDQPWIEEDDGGSNSNGEIRCIRVINLLTGERILVNSEGYDYPRYTAIEEG